MHVHREIDISWGDLDALNHVNNAAYLRYMEDTRMDWFRSMGPDMGSSNSAPAVVNININYRRELRFPARIRVDLEITRASERRIVHRYRITGCEDSGTLYADAELTLVWIDHATRRSVQLPDRVRKSIDGWE